MNIYLIFVLIILFTIGLNTIGQKVLKQRWLLWLGYGLPALVMIGFLGKTCAPYPRNIWFGDFVGAYYAAGRIIIENPSKLYDSGTYGFVNIPIIALLFTPLAALSRRNAILLMTILGLLAVIATCYFLIKLTKVNGWKRIAIIGLFVINGPMYHSFWYGNLSHFIPLLLIPAVSGIKKRREYWIGILLAVAALIKIPLFLLGIYFAVRKKWRIIAGFSAALLVIVGVSVLLFGVNLHLAWLHHIGHFSGEPVSAYNVQSVDGLLARLLLNPNGDLRNWNPIEVDWKFKVIRYALISLLVGTAIWVCWRSKTPTTLEAENLEFSIVLCLALLISPISWTHYYVFLVIPFALYFGNLLAVPQGRLWFASVAVSILLTSLPVITASPTNPVVQFLYSRLLISHYFFGGVLLLGVLLAARWRTSNRSQGKVNGSKLVDEELGYQSIT